MPFKSIIFWLLWIGFITYAVAIAPPDQPETFTLIKNLSTAQVAGINPLIVALFNVMGVLPLLYSCFLYADGHEQKIPAWIFAIASFAVGAFAILPYLALRQTQPTFTGKPDRSIRFWDSRWLGIGLSIATVALLAYGISQGNWQDFIQQWQTSKFIQVMSLDFCCLCLLFPALLKDDMARRNLKDSRIFWAVTLLPLVGTLAYVSLRPAIATDSIAANQLSSAS